MFRSIFPLILICNIAFGQDALLEGKEVSEESFSPRYRTQLHQIRAKAYQEEHKIYQEALLDKYIEQLAEKNKSSYELVKSDLLKVSTPTSTEIKSL